MNQPSSTQEGRCPLSFRRRWHTRLVIFLLGVFFATFFARPLGAQTSELPLPSPESPVLKRLNTPTLKPASTISTNLVDALGRRGDLTLRDNTPLADALFVIRDLWKINLATAALQGEVNGEFKNAPLREILDSILLSNGYGYRPVGETLVISPLEQLGQINPFFKTATIPIHSADVDEVAQGAALLSTPQGQVRAIKSARSLFVIDFPDRVKMIREFVESIDEATRRGMAGQGIPGAGFAQPLKVGTFRTQFISAQTAMEALTVVLSNEGRVNAMLKEDQLLVVDYAENLAMVETVLRRIDLPRPQVRIKVLIYDLSLQDIEQIGINWSSAVKGRSITDASGTVAPQSLFGIDSTTQVPFTGGTVGSALTLMNLTSNVDLTAVILALQNASDSRLLAHPYVTVMDNEEALFQSITEIPFQQLTQTAAGGQIGTTAFKDAGITLRVRPKIAIDGTIKMEVSPEFSRLTGFTPGDNQPIIDRRLATTTLNVANKQVVVIGGLTQRSDVGDFNGVPGLKDLNWFGKLFRSRRTDVRESELVVFIMPEIIGYAHPPNCREQRIVDTVDCRLNQIPMAEGCCPGTAPVMQEILHGPQFSPAPENSVLPVEETLPLMPEEAQNLPDIQFGLTLSDPRIRTLVAEGRLRRLPTTVR